MTEKLQSWTNDRGHRVQCALPFTPAMSARRYSSLCAAASNPPPGMSPPMCWVGHASGVGHHSLGRNSGSKLRRSRCCISSGRSSLSRRRNAACDSNTGGSVWENPARDHHRGTPHHTTVDRCVPCPPSRRRCANGISNRHHVLGREPGRRTIQSARTSSRCASHNSRARTIQTMRQNGLPRLGYCASVNNAQISGRTLGACGRGIVAFPLGVV